MSNTICITRLDLGARFKYKDHNYKVKSREEYPFILAEREDKELIEDYHDNLFWNFEQVELIEGAVLPNPKMRITRVY